MKINSPSFKHDSVITSKHTCDGESISPALHWEDVPAGTKSLVLIVSNPKPPNETPWTHWAIYNLPANCKSLSEDIKELPGEAQFATNSWGKHSYRGPCLPAGKYQYNFTLYALDGVLDIPTTITREGLIQKMEGHILEEALLVGRYERKNQSCNI